MKILETTLRDGSYAIDFQFTPKDTAKIASALESIGFELIEIGHGLGLRAREMGKGDSAATDEEYLESASSVIRRAKFGMFCIPGIARLEDIDMAAKYGMNFIRIGTNINELSGTNVYFERAKKYNMFISSNLMKSYAVPPEEFGKYTKLAQEYGADIAVLVDSAGGMFPNDIEDYFNSSRAYCNIPLGFHGHNNLGLANANTLKAIELDAAIVDSSLKGIGRSAGNAVTEMIVMALKRLGYKLNINEYAAMDLAEKYISPLIHKMKDTPISITTGYAQFHSSFMEIIMKYASMYHIDPRELIVKLTEKDKINAPEDLVEKLAYNIKKEKNYIISRKISPDYFKNILKATREKKFQEQLKVLLNELINLSKKKGKKAILNIVLSDIDKNENFISEFIQESPLFVIGNIEIVGNKYIKNITNIIINSEVDYILLDNSIKKEKDRQTLQEILYLLKPLKKLLLYNDIELLAKTITSLITATIGQLINKKIIIYGRNRLSGYISNILTDFGAELFIYEPRTGNLNINNSIFTSCSVIISCDRLNRLTEEFASLFEKLDIVIDAKIASIDPKCINYLTNLKVLLIRPDMRAALAGEALHQISNLNMVNFDLGRVKIEDFNVVSGGLIGRKDEIVVDSISNPTKVIGISEGNGKVNYTFNKKQQKLINQLQQIIENKL